MVWELSRFACWGRFDWGFGFGLSLGVGLVSIWVFVVGLGVVVLIWAWFGCWTSLVLVLSWLGLGGLGSDVLSLRSWSIFEIFTSGFGFEVLFLLVPLGFKVLG